MPMGKTAVATLVLAMGQGAAGAVTRTVSWYSDATCDTKISDLEFTQSESDPTCWAGPSWMPGASFKVVLNGLAVNTVRFTDSDCTTEDETVIGDDWTQNLPVSAVEEFFLQDACMAVAFGQMSVRISQKMPADGIPDLAKADGSKLSTTAFVQEYPEPGCKVAVSPPWFFSRVGKDSTCWKVSMGSYTMGAVQAVRTGSDVDLKKHTGEDCSGTATEKWGTLPVSAATTFVAGGCADLPGGGSIKAFLPSTLSASVVSGGLPATTRTVKIFEDAKCKTDSTWGIEFVQSESDPTCWAGPWWMPGAGFKVVRTGAGVSLARFKDSDCTKEDTDTSDLGASWAENFDASAVEEFVSQEGCLAAGGGTVFLKMSESMPEDGAPNLSPLGTASQAAPAAGGRWLAGWVTSCLCAVAAVAATTAGSSSLP